MNIWPWSRIRELERANFNLNRRLEQWEIGLGYKIDALNGDIAVPLANLLAIMCDEQSEARKAASDRLAAQTLNQMRGDALARAHSVGEI